jgi:hypothetical protein
VYINHWSRGQGGLVLKSHGGSGHLPMFESKFLVTKEKHFENEEKKSDTTV